MSYHWWEQMQSIFTLPSSNEYLSQVDSSASVPNRTYQTYVDALLRCGTSTELMSSALLGHNSAEKWISLTSYQFERGKNLSTYLQLYKQQQDSHLPTFSDNSENSSSRDGQKSHSYQSMYVFSLGLCKLSYQKSSKCSRLSNSSHRTSSLSQPKWINH